MTAALSLICGVRWSILTCHCKYQRRQSTVALAYCLRSAVALSIRAAYASKTAAV